MNLKVSTSRSFFQSFIEIGRYGKGWGGGGGGLGVDSTFDPALPGKVGFHETLEERSACKYLQIHTKRFSISTHGV